MSTPLTMSTPPTMSKPPLALQIKSALLLRPQTVPKGAVRVKTLKEDVDVKTKGGPYIYWQRQYRVGPMAGPGEKEKLVIVEEYHKITEGMCLVLNEDFGNIPAQDLGNDVFLFVNAAGDRATVGNGIIVGREGRE